MPRKPKNTNLADGTKNTFNLQKAPLAKMKVSIIGKNITKLEVPKSIADADPSTFYSKNALDKNMVDSTESSYASKERKTKKSNSFKKAKKRSKEDIQAIDSIWKHLGDGSIDLSYATVGYGFNGRPILDHDIFVNLLINYGFTIGTVLEFIDDFNEVSLEDDDFPMVMINSHMQRIYQEINPFDEETETKS